MGSIFEAKTYQESFGDGGWTWKVFINRTQNIHLYNTWFVKNMYPTIESVWKVEIQHDGSIDAYSSIALNSDCPLRDWHEWLIKV